MRRLCFLLIAGIAAFALALVAQQASSSGPYKVLKTAKVGGDGGFDYIYADTAGRRLYIPRRGNPAQVTVFNLDTLEPAGEIPNVSAAGVAVSSKSGHGFATSRPIAMWDTKTLMPIKTIDVQGGPDGILYDSFNDRVYILSHVAPNATVINAADGSVLGTIDLGGAPEQAATDGKGHIYVDIEDKGNVAVVDANTMMVTAHYDLMGKGVTCAGLALDAKNGILFSACRNSGMPPAQPAQPTMVILSAKDGRILTTLPLAGSSDGAVFNPATMEAFSTHSNGTLTVVKEKSPTNFEVEENLDTMMGAKTLTLDTRTNHILTMAAEYAAPAAGATPPPPPATAPNGGPGGRGGFGRGGFGRGRGTMVPGSFSILEIGK